MSDSTAEAARREAAADAYAAEDTYRGAMFDCAYRGFIAGAEWEARNTQVTVTDDVVTHAVVRALFDADLLPRVDHWGQAHEVVRAAIAAALEKREGL